MSKRKLLLADDSITIQKVVNLTFADEGIEVIAVGDGDSALRKFDEFIPDLVMADVNMPGKSGYEVCRLIKNTDETRNIPVILLVGSFEPFDETEAKEAGADDFLTKPFQSIRQLVNKVTDLLNKRGAAEQQQQTEAETQDAPVGSSFAETLEMEKPVEQASAEFEKTQEISDEFGDAGMDDEMIETAAATDYISGAETESPVDYGKTQQLTAEDLRSFEMSGGETSEYQESGAETSERAEPASFDEEARKLEYSETAGEAVSEERPEISETEPQIDYYLPQGEEEIEKEITDAETLAPEVSYEPEEPREADFSQAETAGETEETIETSEEASETEIGLAEETRIRETEEGAEAMPEAEIDLSEVSETETAETESAPEAVPETESPVTAANVPPLNFDEGDLLELPPLVEETGIRPLAEMPKPEPAVEETQAAAEPEPAKTLSPEIIEAIAAKVAEKLSAQVLKNLAAEVVPEVTEQIIREISEESRESKK